MRIKQEFPQIEDLKVIEFKSPKDLIQAEYNYKREICVSYDEFKALVLNGNK